MKKISFKLIFAILCISIVPVIYSSLFLGALMDPYGKVSHLPVAVVASENNSVLKSIETNKLFDLKHETNTKAEKDLENGNVYAILKFDNEFNNDLHQFPVQHKHPTITMVTSEGLGYTTTKILKNTMTQFVAKANLELGQKIPILPTTNSPKLNNANILALKNVEKHPVKNNGTSLAPYFFSLTSFVGCIVISQFILQAISKKKVSLKKYWIIEFLIPFIISIVQVALLLGANHYFIKIQIDQPILIIPFFILVSATFISIIVALNKLIPGLGALIVLLLTMLQTSSSGGTYAIQLSGHLFKTINAFLPMTYSIDGFKKLISLNSTNLSHDSLILVGFFLVGQLILLLAYYKHEYRQTKKEISTNAK
ncbi:YhgE/Pip family protein [Fructilactobacillus vespulae]|uniref:YhgE/Pip domain-containing protein n=1 Tax=Fructilactobacillus vespulae TaxID=1249630 RepID=UPI0039B5960F